MICQVCKQNKVPSAFTNRDAMAHVCDDCHERSRVDYYAAMSDPNDDAAAYLRECDEQAREYQRVRDSVTMLPRLVKW